MVDTSITKVSDELVKALRREGYSEESIDFNRQLVAQLGRHCEGGTYSPEAGLSFVGQPRPDGSPYSEQHRAAKGRVVRLVEGFLADGRFDLSAKCPGQAAPPTTPALAESLVDYDARNAERGLAESTRYQVRSMARDLLLFAEDRGTRDVADIDGATVLDFVSHMARRRSGTDPRHIAGTLRPYLEFLGRDDLADALLLVPSHRTARIFEVLTDDEEEAIAAACCCGRATARDSAITLVALTTGLRGGDIARMRVSDVRLEDMTLAITQHKTGNPVVLPLAPAVAEAIVRYATEERPDNGEDRLFLRAVAPHTPIASAATVYNAISRVMRAAGIGHGGGSRLMRRNAATKMLGAGAATPVISAVLGHASPESTNVYIGRDDARMRECVLPLPKGVAR